MRLAIIAELDAINLYLQLARSIDDENVRKVFEDVADEEKTHFGEFLALLKALDPKQAEELEKGALEVRELTGTGEATPQGGGGDPGNSTATSTSSGLLEAVPRVFASVYGEARVLGRLIQVVDLGRGVESTVVERVSGETLERTVVPLKELSIGFKVSQRDLEYASRHGASLLAPELYQAAMKLAVMEDSLILETISSTPGVQHSVMSDWSQEGAPVVDVATAVAKLYSHGVPRPYVLVVSPTNYARMARVSEKTGLLELERVSRLVDSIAVTPLVGDERAIVFSTRPYIVDMVTSGGVIVDYIGPVDGAHAFRAWELVALRVRQPPGIVVLEKK